MLNPQKVPKLKIPNALNFKTLAPQAYSFGLKPQSSVLQPYPRGSIYTTIMELGPQNQNRDGLLVPDSIMVVYMDPLGICPKP